MNDETSRLLTTAERLIETATRRGASAADAAVIASVSRSASVRLGRIETTESAESEDIALRVFVGQRVATVSGDAGSDIETLVERAVAMAKVSPEDPFAGLADPALLSPADLELDLYDPTEFSSSQLAEQALVAEDAARAVAGVTNSGGAGASAGSSGLVLATTAGFSGHRRRSGFSCSASVIAGEGVMMQRDYDFDSRLHAADLDAAAAIGRRAGERAVRRLDPRKPATGRYRIVFDPRVARGLVAHILAAVNGAAIARGTSFLKDRMHRHILPRGMSLRDEPLLARRPGSRAFDGEGVRGGPLSVVEDGILNAWLLDTATARELGLVTNGRASRSAGGVSPSSTNAVLTPGTMTPEELIRDTGRGLYIDELIGQGADLVTGDYSRGASGYMIEDGELTHPVSEFTVAGNLADMFLALTAANDTDTRFSIVAPTLRLGEMTVAGG